MSHILQADYTSKTTSHLKSALQIAAATLLLALSAQVALPLPFTPVPVTLQTLVVLFIAATLGSKKGSLAILAYLFEGALGLPVFSQGGASLAWLFGPTGGYLWGFVLSAFFVGYCFEKGCVKSYFATLTSMTIGLFLSLSVGTFFLSTYIGIASAFSLGFMPFIVAEVLKALIATSLIPLRVNSSSY